MRMRTRGCLPPICGENCLERPLLTVWEIDFQETCLVIWLGKCGLEAGIRSVQRVSSARIVSHRKLTLLPGQSVQGKSHCKQNVFLVNPSEYWEQKTGAGGPGGAAESPGMGRWGDIEENAEFAANSREPAVSGVLLGPLLAGDHQDSKSTQEIPWGFPELS